MIKRVLFVLRKVTMPLVAVLCMTALAADVAVPDVVKAMPPDGRKDVKIHFYIDGHRRNKDANMRKETSDAYIRAINALRIILADRNNPIDAGLRQRGIGKNVEVNTGNAYLLKPDGIVPFSLSKKAKESDFGEFAAEEGAWDCDVLVKQILENEKGSENLVICVVSNDPSLNRRDGCFYLDDDKGIMFFMLHAPRESVNGGIFHPYWSVKEWESFLREAMGVNANDIANAIVDNYYALTTEEEAGLKAVVSTSEDESISLKKVRSLPLKKMWKSTITHNGVEISKEDDAQTLVPKSGQNKVVAQLISPAGVTYSRTWEQDSYFYVTLNQNADLLNRAKAVVEKAKAVGIDTSKFAEIDRLVKNPQQPMKKAKLEDLGQDVNGIHLEVERIVKLRELKDAVAEIEKGVEKINTLTLDDELANLVDNKIKKRLSAINGFVKEDLPAEEIDRLKNEVKDIKKALVAIEKAIVEKGRKLLVDKINEKREEVKTAETSEKKCTNLSELDGFADRAEKAATKDDIQTISDEVNKWTAKFEITKKPPVDVKDPPVTNSVPETVTSNKGEGITSTTNKIGKIDTSVTPSSDNDGGEVAAKAETPAEEKAETPAEEEESNGGGGLDFFTILFALVVLGGIGFGVKHFMKAKSVATISYQKTGSTDAPVSAEAMLNKEFRFDESLECEIDIRATPKKIDTDNLEYDLTSPNRTVWLLKLGNDRKKKIAGTSVLVDDGKYQVFDNEIAMQPIATVTFESIQFKSTQE